MKSEPKHNLYGILTTLTNKQHLNAKKLKADDSFRTLSSTNLCEFDKNLRLLRIYVHFEVKMVKQRKCRVRNSVCYANGMFNVKIQNNNIF